MTRAPMPPGCGSPSRDSELSRLLRSADPVGAEPPLQPAEEAALRCALDRAAAPEASWPRARRGLVALAAAAAIAGVALVWGPGRAPRPEASGVIGASPPVVTADPPPSAGRPTGAKGTTLTATRLTPRHLAPPLPLRPSRPVPASGDARRAGHRQIHLTAANGTRIVWSVSAEESPAEPASREKRS